MLHSKVGACYLPCVSFHIPVHALGNHSTLMACIYTIKVHCFSPNLITGNWKLILFSLLIFFFSLMCEFSMTHSNHKENEHERQSSWSGKDYNSKYEWLPFMKEAQVLDLRAKRKKSQKTWLLYQWHWG